MVLDLLRDCIALVDRTSLSEWVHWRVPDHAGLMDLGRSKPRMDRHHVRRHRSYLGGCLHALDAAARGLWHRDQRDKREIVGYERARTRLSAAAARADVVDGRLSCAIS